MQANRGTQPPATPIAEFSGLTPDRMRRELQSAWRPAVLRGLARDWPAVTLARRSTDALAAYLRRLDSGAPVDAILTPPEARGRIFYSAGLAGFNFVRNRLPLSAVIEQVLRYGAFAQPPAVAVQSAPIRDCLPGFAAENRLDAVDAAVQPRIWLGNAITTPTHLDEWHNIGCVVCGRRRFTLFPPEQIANLYIGPLDYAPTGAPMSLVRLDEPDFERFPRFRAALAARLGAELEPGDAIYIPPLWWHHVESLGSFNVLVNYWWHAAAGQAPGGASGFDALLQAILVLRSLPDPARAAWRSLFEHYVFGAPGEVTAHIPVERRGILGELTPEHSGRLRAALLERLKTRP